ncbi:IMPACT family protein [Halocatena marina]|uniref:IMPACT family protein n=1 Tax=Halocatena marina TaxID=2934937 RepID=UPI00200E68AC|nr:YigZ family protein [Halocatena marina]
MSESYHTLSKRGESSFSVQGSEFIGYASPKSQVSAAEAFIETVQEQHTDATHNVPAYRVRTGDNTLGSHMLREYSNDDGEPSGSAGKPMLNVLQGKELENVVVVVTRYFGGTELGVGGLVRAYSRAVKEAVADAGVIETVPHERFTVTVEYSDSGTVRGVLESTGVEFDAHYETDVSFDVRVPIENAESLRDRLQSATSGRARINGDESTRS